MRQLSRVGRWEQRAGRNRRRRVKTGARHSFRAERLGLHKHPSHVLSTICPVAAGCVPASDLDVAPLGLHAVSEHVENAGVHSGDATLVLPPVSLTESDMTRLKEIAQKVATAFEISGPYNMQIIKKPAEDGEEAQLKVIECNLRASRSFPFVSKVLGYNFIDYAAAAISGHNVPEPVDAMAQKRDYTAVKVAQFSWTRLPGADPFLGVGE